MADIRVLLGSNIRSARKRLGLTQEELGTAADLTKTSVFTIEKGETWPAFTTLENLSKALRLNSVLELFAGVEQGLRQAKVIHINGVAADLIDDVSLVLSDQDSVESLRPAFQGLAADIRLEQQEQDSQKA